MQYQVLVFLHILGALGLFAALGIEAVALRGLRREGAGVWLGLFSVAARIGMISMVLLLAAGIALMTTVWHHQPWISAAFVGIAVMAVLGAAVTARKLRALRASVAGGRSSGALVAALVVRIAIAVGIVGLMTAKPNFAGSARMLAAAALFGAVASIPGLRKSGDDKRS